MFIAYLTISLLIWICLSFMWSSNGMQNCIVKTLFVIQTIWTGLTLLSVVWPLIQSGQIKLI